MNGEQSGREGDWGGDSFLFYQIYNKIFFLFFYVFFFLPHESGLFSQMKKIDAALGYRWGLSVELNKPFMEDWEGPHQ